MLVSAKDLYKTHYKQKIKKKRFKGVLNIRFKNM